MCARTYIIPNILQKLVGNTSCFYSKCSYRGTVCDDFIFLELIKEDDKFSCQQTQWQYYYNYVEAKWCCPYYYHCDMAGRWMLYL